jgi:plasmid stabilization system protein ParE
VVYTIVLDPRAIRDIQQAIEYYDEQVPGLGEKFVGVLNKQLLLLEKNPFFRIRYDSVRCLSLKKFPYMVHFTVDEEHRLVAIWAVLHTSMDPNKWKKRK